MFTIILRKGPRIFIGSQNDFLILPVKTFERAKNRKDRGARIRQAVTEVINGTLFIFTRKEWANGKTTALKHKEFLKDLPRVFRDEIQEKIKSCKRLAKQRNLRSKLEADVAGRRRNC